MGFKLSEAFVVVGARLSSLAKGLDAAKGMVISGIKSMGSLAVAAGRAAFSGLSTVIGGAINIVKLGSDMEEMRSKFTAVFKEEEGAARDFATGLGDSIGRSQVEIEGFMASFQDLFVPMGFARQDARALSQTITQLGYDLASFNNMEDADAIQTLNAGLTGSSEVLKKFGIFINENVLSQKLLAMGTGHTNETASEQEKMMARLAIVMESTTDAQGDAARTSDGLANSWKRLTGNLFDLASKIGIALVPAAKGVVGVFQHLTDWFKGNEGSVISFTEMIGEGFDQVVGFVSDQVSRIINIWDENWALVGPTVMEAWGLVSSIIVDGVASIIAEFVSIMEWCGQLERAMFQFAGASQEGMVSAGKSIGETWEWIKKTVGGVLEWIKSAIETGIFVIMNWDLAAKRVGIGMAEVFVNIYRRIANTFENAGILVNWFFGNFTDIAFTAFEGVTTMFINLGQNIRNLWQSVLDFIRTGEFKFNPTPLLDGMKSTISKMPQFKPFEAGNFDDQWAELDKETNRRMEKWKGAMQDQAPKAVADGIEKGADQAKPKLDPGKLGMPNIKANDKGKEKAEKKTKVGEITDIAAVWGKMQSAVLKDEMKVPKQQLDVAKQHLAEQQLTNKKLDKKPVAVYA